MSFPTVTARTVSQDASDTNNHVVALPTHAVGDGILVCVSAYDPNFDFDDPVDWYVFDTTYSGDSRFVAKMLWKVAESASETLTLTHTGSSYNDKWCWTVHVITPSSGMYMPYPTSTGSAAPDSSTNTNPPTHTPPYGTQDYLWIVFRHFSSTGAQATVAPASFSNLQSDNNTAVCGCDSAERSVNGSSLNPGAFTSPSSTWAGSTTIAIHETAIVGGFLGFFF